MNDVITDYEGIETAEISKKELIAEMLTEMRLLELRDIVDMAQHALEKREIEEFDRARQRIQEMAEELNISPEHLIGTKSGNGQAKGVRIRRRKGELKGYRNPDNPAQTWSGKGRKPAWFTDAVGAGTSIDSMRI